MSRMLILLSLCFAPWLGCRAGVPIPEGDSERGRVVFAELQCYSCHEVAGESFPAPTASPPVPVKFGAGEEKSREYWAESIVAPSHRFAKPKASVIYSDPPVVLQEEYENVRSGELSRMGDFNDVLTVRQLADLATYLEELGQREPER